MGAAGGQWGKAEGELQEFLAHPPGQHPLEEEARRKARLILESPP